MAIIPAAVICKKRDGASLSRTEIFDFVLGYSHGEIPDYQMAALAMAIFFRSMDAEETSFLTEAMRPTHEPLHAEPKAPQAELRPMIEISTTNFPNYERGLWLNNCDLHAYRSFQFHRL